MYVQFGNVLSVKLLSFSHTSIQTYVLGAQKNRLIEKKCENMSSVNELNNRSLRVNTVSNGKIYQIWPQGYKPF